MSIKAPLLAALAIGSALALFNAGRILAQPENETGQLLPPHMCARMFDYHQFIKDQGTDTAMRLASSAWRDIAFLCGDF